MAPRSIYQSPQFFFSTTKGTSADPLTVDDYSAAFKPLQMRIAVEIKGGVASKLSLYDEPIKSAMQTLLDPSSVSSSPIPASFPNGSSARQGHQWRDAALSTARRELDKAREASSVAIKRWTRTSNGVERGVSSVSFEDEEDEDDALFAEVARSAGSTAATSVLHQECDDLGDDPDAPWGIEGPAVDHADHDLPFQQLE